MALGLAALPLTAANAGSTWRVTIKSSTHQVVAGKKVVLSGHVRPVAPAAGTKVTLQEMFKPGAKWKKKDQVKVRSDGTYRVVTRPTTGFTHSYRVVMPASPHHAKGVSPTVKVTVYAWSDLSTHQAVNDVSMEFDTVNINGTSYPDSLWQHWDSSGSVEFNVNHDCIQLRSTYGLSDQSTTGGQGEVSVQSDGTPLYSNTFDVGQSATKTVALDPAPLKLRLEAHNTSTTNGVFGYGAFGRPQVLCTQ
jgi:NPCBM/NEW2 domain